MRGNIRKFIIFLILNYYTRVIQKNKLSISPLPKMLLYAIILAKDADFKIPKVFEDVEGMNYQGIVFAN